MRFILSLVLGAFLYCFLTPNLGAFEQEVLFGSYIFTLRNLNTRGATLAYRFWLTPEEEPSPRRFSLLYPSPLILGFELRGGRIYRPETAWEAGLAVALKYEKTYQPKLSSYIFISGGGSYSGADYTNVPTHYNFLTRGGIGLRVEHFILQGAYEHRSNANLRKSNRGVDLLQFSLGFWF